MKNKRFKYTGKSVQSYWKTGKMLTKKQLKIFGIFAENTFKEYSFKELKKSSKEKSNSVMQDAIKKFLNENLILEKKIGTSKLYSINHKNKTVYNYLSLFINGELPKEVLSSLIILKKEIEKYTFFYSLIMFGSYADSKFTKKSDLDVAIIIPDKKTRKNIEIAINSAGNKSLINLDAHIITTDEFLEMLKANYENLGKEIARKNIPVHNINIFYKIINKGIENGFKIIP